jgi:uncharacterized protein (TIGR04255 family)
MATSKPLRHPPLSEVAFELNFPRQFAVESRIAEYQERLAQTYPNSGDEFILRLPPSAAFSKPPKSEGAGLNPVRSFVFQNPAASRVVRISIVNFNLLVSDYLDFEDYKGSLKAALAPAVEIFHLHHLERVGLRYINKLSIPAEGAPQSYGNYVRPPLDAGIFLPHQLSSFLMEASLDLEGKKKLTVRNGLLPAEADSATRTYLLDLDCYSSDSVSLSGDDLPNLLDEYHDAIETEFKRAINEDYWNYLAEGEPS